MKLFRTYVDTHKIIKIIIIVLHSPRRRRKTPLVIIFILIIERFFVFFLMTAPCTYIIWEGRYFLNEKSAAETSRQYPSRGRFV